MLIDIAEVDDLLSVAMEAGVPSAVPEPESASSTATTAPSESVDAASARAEDSHESVTSRAWVFGAIALVLVVLAGSAVMVRRRRVRA